MAAAAAAAAGAQLKRETNVTLNPAFGTSSVNKRVDKRKRLPLPPAPPLPPFLPLLLCVQIKTPDQKCCCCCFCLFFFPPPLQSGSETSSP